MTYVINAAVLAAILIVIAVGLDVGTATFLFPIVSWGGIVWLSILAFAMRRDGRLRLGLAALIVQGFGVFSLMVGLAISLGGISADSVHIVDGSFREFAPVITPVTEAFIASGLAILVAVSLRASEDLIFKMRGRRGSGSLFGESDGLWESPRSASIGDSAAMATLRREVTAMSETIQAVNVEAQKIAPALQGFSSLLEQVGRLLSTLDRFFVREGGAGG